MSTQRPFYHSIDRREVYLISGFDFAPTTRIFIGGDSCTPSDFQPGESGVGVEFHCELGPTQQPLGRKDVVFSNPDGSSFTVPGGFVYTSAAPEITSFEPMSGHFGELLQLTIRGRNFRSGMEVWIGDQRCNNIRYIGAETVTCNISFPPQFWSLDASITVINPDQGRNTFGRLIIQTRNRDTGLGGDLNEASGNPRSVPGTSATLRREAQRRMPNAPLRVLDSNPVTLARWRVEASERIARRTAARNGLREGHVYGRVETIMNAQITRRYLQAIDHLESRYPSAVPNSEHSLNEVYQMVRHISVGNRGQSGEHKREAALRYLERVITNHEYDNEFGYHYGGNALIQDPNHSGLTNRQLLSLTWYAINDPVEFNEVQREDRKWGLLESLANIQRAHNDSGDVINFDASAEEDSPSCGPGTFKRLLEHLDLSHSEVRLTELPQEPGPGPTHAPSNSVRITNSMVAHEVQLQHAVLFGRLSPAERLAIEESLQSLLDTSEVDEGSHASSHFYLSYVERLRNEVRRVSVDIPIDLLKSNTNRDMMQALLNIY